MSSNVIRVVYKRNQPYILSTGKVTPDANGNPILGAGTLTNTSTGALVGATDASCYASAVDANGATILAPTAATWISGGRFDYTLDPTLFDGTHGNFAAYLKVYAFGQSTPATEQAEFRFDLADGQK